MIRKIILLSFLLVNFLQATTVTINQTVYKDTEAILASYSDMSGGEKDWIAIYKAGSSNSWKNVIRWKWIKSEQDGSKRFEPLPIGQYDIRVFFNNTYQAEASKKFTVSNEVYFKTMKQTDSKISFNSVVKPKAWIGIYEKGKNNSWKNVKAWKWVTTTTTHIRLNSLKKGDYEARLFFNNSYKMEKSLDFTMHPGAHRLAKTLIGVPHSAKFVVNVDNLNTANPKDWIGIFPKGAAYNRSNLLAWGYAQDRRYSIEVKTITNELLPIGTYEIVYFTNDSYNQEGKTVELSIKNNFSVSYIDYRTNNDKFQVWLYDYRYIAKDKDWVAIFKKDDAPIKENIIARAYIEDGEIIRDDKYHYYLYFPDFPQENIQNTHKIVFFTNDTYKILGESLILESE